MSDLTQKELEDAKSYFVNSFVFKYSTPVKILKNKILNEFYGLEENYFEKLLKKIKKVNKKDILNISRSYLNPDKMIIYIVGPEKLEKDIKIFGKIKNIDITIPPFKKK